MTLDQPQMALAVAGLFRYKMEGMKTGIRLSIKLSVFTTLMVVVSMLASFMVAGGRVKGGSAWVFIFSVVSFGVGLLYTLFLDRIITVPVLGLVRYTSEMVKDDFQRPVPLQGNDEIGTLARAMDDLRRNFLEQRRSLQELNEQLDAKVEARTLELEQALAHLRATQEELLKAEKLASVGRLAGGLAHEINNPAGIILTRTGLLLETAQDEKLSDEIVESLRVIDRQVSRISRITQDLMVFSRMAPMSIQPVGLSDLLHWSWSLYSQKARELRVQMQGEVPAGIQVLGDSAALEQVFGNLIKNALDSMEETGGVLTRRIRVADARVQVLLEDTGPGIPLAVLPRIFDPFFTTKKVGKGTGLGLAISYGILEELGGTLEAANRPNGGAVFTVTLPVAPADARSEMAQIWSTVNRG